VKAASGTSPDKRASMHGAKISVLNHNIKQAAVLGTGTFQRLSQRKPMFATKKKKKE